MKLRLPYPPSVNHYWRRVGVRTLISRSGRKFRDDVQRIVGNCEPMGGRLRVVVVVYPPDRRRRDLDNVLKSLLDALDHADVYGDDSQIDQLEVVRGERRVPGECEVGIFPFGGGER